MISVTINSTSFEYKDGFTFKENLNEELNTGMLVIPQVASFSIEPLDEVVISDTWTKYFLVSEYRKNTVEFGSKYTYEISLISPTLLLQRIVLPNRSITQPLLVDDRFDILSVVEKYLELYAPNFTLSSSLKSLISGVECAEFQWNRPTLYEVLNDLLSQVDAVVTMTSFTEISYINLNARGSAINTSLLSDEYFTQSAQDYASNIDLEVSNAVVRFVNTKTIEWLHPKSSEVIVTDENMQIVLDKPIYKLNYLGCFMTYEFSGSAIQTNEVDLTAYVLEKTLYDLCKTSSSTSYLSGDYKRNRFYFEEGSNIIDGLSFKEDTFLGISSRRAMINVFQQAYLDQYSVDYSTVLAANNCYFLFRAEWTTVETVKVKSFKQDSVGHESSLINNQSTSYVDFIAFNRQQQLTADRLANPTHVIMGRYDSLDDVPSLGDVIGDEVLSQREVAINADYVNFKGIMTENYILQELYSGLNMKRRYTQFATDAFESSDVNVIRMIFQFTDHASNNIASYHAKLGQKDEKVKLAHLVFNFADATTSDDYAVSVSSYYTDTSVALTFKMEDNISVGRKIESTDVFSFERLGLTYAPYTDANGEFKSYDVEFYTEFFNSDIYSPSTFTQYETGLNYAYLYPKINPSKLNSIYKVFYQDAVLKYKDNRMITSETWLFPVRGDSGIFVKPKFFSDHPAVYQGTSDKILRVAYSTTEEYTRFDTLKKGTLTSSIMGMISIAGNAWTVSVSGLNWATVKSWAICDSSGNLYIAVNGNTHTIYLNTED